MRLYLLTTYGGTWIDATLYFTDRIPQKIFDSEFFVLQKNPKTDAFGDKMSCYFIRADKNSYFAHLTRNALEKYWEENDYLIHYFIFEHVVSMLSEANDELKQVWNNMYFRNTNNLGLLRNSLGLKFDNKKFDEIKKESFIHKLTYKKSFENVGDDSFYNFIVNQGE